MRCEARAALERGLLAQLSPNEEVTLRRIAHEMVGTSDLNQRDVDHLTALELVCVRCKSFALTGLGLRRVAQVSNHMAGRSGDDEHLAAIAKAFG
jgi:hypothetical protein